MADESALRRMLESGAALGGATSGAAVGLLIAGPPGAIAGAGAGWAIEEVMKVGAEYALRHLAPRAEVRVGSVLLLAYQEISARVMAGEVPRDDLRAEITPGRSPAAELAEAVVRAAADTHEERKLPYLAHLLASIVFEPDLTHAHANQLVTVAEQLTYRQLVALAVYLETDGASREMYLHGEGSEHGDESPELLSLRVDLLDLFRRGLVHVSKRERTVRKDKPPQPGPRRGFSANPFDHYDFVKEALPWPAIPLEISPREMRLTSEGERLARLMRLHEVPAEEREHLVLEHLRAERGGS